MTAEQNSTNGSTSPVNDNPPRLVVEGGIKVLYKGIWVTEIPFDQEEITIGVMDPENNIYPDINLRQCRLDGGDPYISRRHGRFFYEEGQYFIEDICKNNSTSLDTKSNIVNGETRELKDDTRIFISESVVFHFTFAKAEEQEDTEKAEAQPVKEETVPEEAKAEDKEKTAEDKEKTAEDKEKTAEDKEETAEDKEETTEDKEETAEDKEKTAEDKEKAAEGEEETAEGKEQDKAKDEHAYYLEVKGQVPLFFKPRNIFTHIIELNPEEWDKDSLDGKKSLRIGRRSTEDGIYPDIDLWKFYFNDGDEYIARQHARIYADGGKLFFQDISGKGSTWINEKDDEHRLVHTAEDEAAEEIEPGDRLIISDSATFIVHVQ